MYESVTTNLTRAIRTPGQLTTALMERSVNTGQIMTKTIIGHLTNMLVTSTIIIVVFLIFILMMDLQISHIVQSGQRKKCFCTSVIFHIVVSHVIVFVCDVLYHCLERIYAYHINYFIACITVVNNKCGVAIMSVYVNSRVHTH